MNVARSFIDKIHRARAEYDGTLSFKLFYVFAGIDEQPVVFAVRSIMMRRISFPSALRQNKPVLFSQASP
jgi:hypothetical protein